MITTAGQRLPALHARMKTRRAQLGLTGTELAQRVGISPSYVSLIEKGTKVPEEEVAARLARALNDDESLYRAWARAARLGLHDLDLLKRLEVIARTPAYVDLVESGQTLPRFDTSDASARPEPTELAARMREVAAHLASAPDRAELAPAIPLKALADSDAALSVVRIPVFAPGTDPDHIGIRSPVAPATRDVMLLDRRLFAEADPGPLFAYDVPPEAMKHLRGLAEPGDRIVFRRGQEVTPQRICVVRTAQGIVLARSLLKGHSLLLLPGDGESAFESVDVPDPKDLGAIVAGVHVLVIRR